MEHTHLTIKETRSKIVEWGESKTCIGALHDPSQFFVWSLTVGVWNHINTPYKSTHKTSLKARIRFQYLLEKWQKWWCLHLSQGALKRSGDGIQNQSVRSPGGLFITKFEYHREATWTAESLTAEIYSEMNYLTGEISDG